jgi:hypothetical protein
MASKATKQNEVKTMKTKTTKTEKETTNMKKKINPTLDAMQNAVATKKKFPDMTDITTDELYRLKKTAQANKWRYEKVYEGETEADTAELRKISATFTKVAAKIKAEIDSRKPAKPVTAKATVEAKAKTRTEKKAQYDQSQTAAAKAEAVQEAVAPEAPAPAETPEKVEA